LLFLFPNSSASEPPAASCSLFPFPISELVIVSILQFQVGCCFYLNYKLIFVSISNYKLIFVSISKLQTVLCFYFQFQIVSISKFEIGCCFYFQIPNWIGS
jgi:hypothetical protein